MKKMIQTVGRSVLEEFALQFAHFNDDVPSGENWNNHDVDVKTRGIITVVVPMVSGITDTSLKFHLQNVKRHGVTQKGITAIIIHVAFYAGWPKEWAVSTLVKGVWNVNEGDLPYEDATMWAHVKGMIFPIGDPNDDFAKYLSGRSFLASVSTSQVVIYNVTFEPGRCNNWHTRHMKSDGGRILICVVGCEFYQEEGKSVIETKAGDHISILEGVKYWHGAASNERFSHLVIEVPRIGVSNEWCESVMDEQYL